MSYNKNFGKASNGSGCSRSQRHFSSPQMKRFESDLEAKKIIYNNNPILKVERLSNSAISVDRNDNIATGQNKASKT